MSKAYQTALSNHNHTLAIYRATLDGLKAYAALETRPPRNDIERRQQRIAQGCNSSAVIHKQRQIDAEIRKFSDDWVD